MYKCTPHPKKKKQENKTTTKKLVVSNCWTGFWTGSLDWTAGLDYWTDVWTKSECITWPQPDQMCWIGSHVQCLVTNRLPRILETKDTACSNCRTFVPKRPWKTLKGMHILQQMVQLGRPIGTIIYSKASRWLHGYIQQDYGYYIAW